MNVGSETRNIRKCNGVWFSSKKCIVRERFFKEVGKKEVDRSSVEFTMKKFFRKVFYHGVLGLCNEV